MVGFIISNNLPNQISFNASRNLEHKTRKCRPDNTQHIAHGSGNTETRTVRVAGQLCTRVECAVVTLVPNQADRGCEGGCHGR